MPQLFQRFHGTAPKLIDRLQGCFVFLCHFLSESSGVGGPLLLPQVPGNIPEEHIVFELCGFLRFQPGQTRFEIKQDIICAKTGTDSLQSGQHKAHERLIIDRLGLIHKIRNAAFLKRAIQNAGVSVGIAGNDGKIGIAESLLHDKAANGRGDERGFLIDVSGPIDAGAVLFLPCLALCAVQIIFQEAQAGCVEAFPRRQDLRHGNGNTAFPCQCAQPPRRIFHEGKKACPAVLIVKGICAQRNHRFPRLFQNHAKDLIFLHGEGGEGIDRHKRILEKTVFPQKRKHAREIVERIQKTAGNKRVIGRKDEGNLPQLAAERPLRQTSGCLPQFFRGHFAHLELSGHIEKQRSQFPAGCAGAIEFQLILHSGEGEIHEKDAPSIVQPFARSPAVPAEPFVRKTRKAEDVHILRVLSSQKFQHGPFVFKRGLLRHDQKNGRFR